MAKNKGKSQSGSAKQSQSGKKSSQTNAKPASKKPAPKPAPKSAVKKPAASKPVPRRNAETAAVAMTLRLREGVARPAMSSLDYACLVVGAALVAYGVFVFVGIEFGGKNAGGYILGVLAFTGGALLACLGGPAIRNFLVPARDPMENYEVITPGSESRARQTTAGITSPHKPLVTHAQDTDPENSETDNVVAHEAEPVTNDSPVEDIETEEPQT